MMRDSQAGERTLVKFVLNDSDAGTRQSRIRRPTLSLLPPLALRTTTISPLAGEMPVRAKLFAPCVQRGPGRGLVGAGDVRRGAEAEEDCEESEAAAAHGGDPVKNTRSGARRRRRWATAQATPAQ